jgi:hypothetical protein
MRLGTQADLEKDFGPGNLLIGSPVRPKPEDNLANDKPVDTHEGRAPADPSGEPAADHPR